MSMKNRVKETMSAANRDMIPDDVGLLPGTFIRPVWKNMPSIFKDPKLRLRMEWMSLKMKVMNFISGDIPSLQRICCQGIYQNFAARISRRPHTTPRLLWTLHSYKKFPFASTFSGAQIVSDRAAALPDAKGFGIRQTVVRIQSKQSLITPSTGEGQNDAAQQIEKQQECTEYVVLQRFMINWEDGDWKVWGLAEETTPEDLERDPMFAPGLSMKDRIELLTMRFK
ncbi:hypothetical protein PRK78_002981 [Emydomyces testavorans]|uniref:Tim44-like domain-containing protein n=1 Tax=Emydomyces testavorans TaxID=2070801 RepID=A0AAF0DG38_9EURO|nr:hypothetical protein PRK78_002981 [Emydomyces testavorans]